MEFITALGDNLILRSSQNNMPSPVSVTNDSRLAGKNTVFTAIRGAAADGHNFIPDALKAGSRIIVCEQIPAKFAENKEILFLQVKNSYRAYAELAEFFAGYPGRKVRLAGITGTNGKTTTAYLLHALITADNKKCGLVSTVEYDTGSGKKITADRTTPDSFTLQNLFSDMLKNGCGYAVMEVSSHALAQHRTGSAKFAAALFTNLSGDHLDYHKTMDEYFEAKKRLFTTSLDETGIGIINTDDAYGERLYNELKSRKNIYSFGMEKSADFAIQNMNLNISGASFELSIPEQNNGIKINSSLCGKFNVYNAAAAAAAAFMLGVPPETISRALKNAPQVPGRMEKCLDSPLVFVDYAHTDDALENVLSAVSGILEGRPLTVIFGCGGDRDRSKRPRMGKAAANFADRIIVTSDNPRTENPESIIQDIIAGIPDSANFAVFPDRKYAIEETLRNSQPDDVIVIAGKGHETYQEINGTRIYFDDRKTVRKLATEIQD